MQWRLLSVSLFKRSVLVHVATGTRWGLHTEETHWGLELQLAKEIKQPQTSHLPVQLPAEFALEKDIVQAQSGGLHGEAVLYRCMGETEKQGRVRGFPAREVHSLFFVHGK